MPKLPFSSKTRTINFTKQIWLCLIPFFITHVTGDTSIPIATNYKAFGPLPLGAKGVDPISVLGDDIFKILETIKTFPSEPAYGGYATWRGTYYNSSEDSGIIYGNFSDAQQSYEAYFLSNFTTTPPLSSSLSTNSSQDNEYFLLKCSNVAIIRSMSDKTNVHCSPDVYDDGRSLCPVKLKPNEKYQILVHLSSASNQTEFLCNYFFSPFHPLPTSFLLRLNDSLTPNIVINPNNNNAPLLAGKHASITIQNLHDVSWANLGTAKIISGPKGITLMPIDNDNDNSSVILPSVAPGQIQQIRLDFSIDSQKFLLNLNNASEPSEINVELELNYMISNEEMKLEVNLSFPIIQWGIDKGYHFTYVDIDETIQAAAVLPPSEKCDSERKCTILLSTHGAGVDAISWAWIDSYKIQKQSFIILPTGRRKFGLNWEGPQMKSALTSYYHFVKYLPGVPLDELDDYQCINNTWLQAGHSMGGHGALLLSAHYPDNLLASLPAMAWLRLDDYGGAAGFDENWSYSDSILRGLLYASKDDYAADLFAENLLGIPFLARVGSDDDNVPPTNLRKFHRLLRQNELLNNISESVVGLSEVPGEGHWFDGVVDDDVLQPFLDKHLKSGRKPMLPKSFTLLTINPSTTGSRGGLRIIQMEVTFEMSRLRIRRQENDEWIVRTENVRRFEYSPVIGIEELPKRIFIDGASEGINIPDGEDVTVEFCSKPSTHMTNNERSISWGVCNEKIQDDEKGIDNSGSGFEILTKRKIYVIYPEDDERIFRFCIRYLNALYLRGISIKILPDTPETIKKYINLQDPNYNIILIGGPLINRVTKLYVDQKKYTSDIQLNNLDTKRENGFCINSMHTKQKCFNDDGTAIAFVSNGPKRTLIYYLHGTDHESLLAILDWLPYSTYSEIPEWIIINTKYKHYGVTGYGGIIALGYWDWKWRVDVRKTYPSEFLFDNKISGVACDSNIHANHYNAWKLFGWNDDSEDSNTKFAKKVIIAFVLVAFVIIIYCILRRTVWKKHKYDRVLELAFNDNGHGTERSSGVSVNDSSNNQGCDAAESQPDEASKSSKGEDSQLLTS